MRTVQIDFDVFKAITARRTREEMSENDVLRDLFELGKADEEPADAPIALTTMDGRFWQSEGVKFPVGMKLTHTFRSGHTVEAHVTENGLVVDGKVYGGLSPAGVAVAGYQLNGWRFWGLLNKGGKWVTADSLRG